MQDFVHEPYHVDHLRAEGAQSVIRFVMLKSEAALNPKPLNPKPFSSRCRT